LSFIEAGDDDLHLKFTEVERARGRLRMDADLESLGRKFASAEVLHHILADAAAEGGEQQFSGRHALVGGSVFGGLVEHNPVMPCLRGEGCSTGVL
jgi:hypothetical protein